MGAAASVDKQTSSSLFTDLVDDHVVTESEAKELLPALTDQSLADLWDGEF